MFAGSVEKQVWGVLRALLAALSFVCLRMCHEDREMKVLWTCCFVLAALGSAVAVFIMWRRNRDAK